MICEKISAMRNRKKEEHEFTQQLISTTIEILCS